MDHPSMVPSSTIPSSSTCGPATPNIPVTSWLASGIGVRLSWSKMKTFWSIGILASWHLWGGISKQNRNSGSLLAGVFLFKWQCVVNSGIDFFPWSQDEMRVWKMAGHQAFSTTLPHLGSPKGSHQMCFSTILTLGQLQVAARKSQEVLLAGRGFWGPGSGGADVVLFPRNFWWNRGGILVGNRWKTSHFLKKMGATTICQQTPRSYHFWAHFWGDWELQTAKRPFFGKNRWL